MFDRAIVRIPCASFQDGLTSVSLGTPNLERALQQHATYVQALQQSGIEVDVLEADNVFPDSTFVEDVAVLTPDIAVLTRPGAESRRGEVEPMRPVIERYYDAIECIQPPGTLDGGDVLMTDHHAFIGLSQRTNRDGAKQLVSILKSCGMTGSTIDLAHVLHLKTGVAWLGGQTLLVAGELINHPAFNDFERITVPEKEAYAANCIAVNGRLFVAAGFPQTRMKLKQAGYDIVELNMSEFQKMDGGLSCPSLRF